MRGTVVILHGRTEFIEKYFETVNDLRRRGFAVAAFDARGQGGSARLLGNPRKGHVRDFADHVNDFETIMQEVVLPDCPPPYYVLAHSTGATVALLSAERLRTQIERMVLTAPLLALAARLAADACAAHRLPHAFRARRGLCAGRRRHADPDAARSRAIR